MNLVVALSLLPFFMFFSKDDPYRMAAVKALEEAIPKELLEENAAWYEAWKASGYDQEIYMPSYFSQRDNKSGQGHRECFSSAAAMISAYYGKVSSDDEYNKIREKFGDTTSVTAQLETLQSLGLTAEFRQDADADMVERQLELGRPVLMGYLSAGNFLRGEPAMCDSVGCGHWLVVNGYRGKNSADPQWVVHDPNGFPELETGGHSGHLSGKNVTIRQALMNERWQVGGTKTGWVIFVHD